MFFDRSIVDALSGIEARSGEPWLSRAAAHPYHARVFLASPWPDIYVQNDERRHDFAAAEREYHRLRRDYPALGYDVVELPKTSVEDRAAFVLARLGVDATTGCPTAR